MNFYQAVFPKNIKKQNEKTSKEWKMRGSEEEEEVRNTYILSDVFSLSPPNQSDQKLRKIGTRLDFKGKIISNRNKHLSKLDSFYVKTFSKKKKSEKSGNLMEVLREGSRSNRSLNNQNRRGLTASCYSASFMGDRMRREHESYIDKHLNSPVNGTNNSVVGQLFERQTNIFNELCHTQNNNTTHVDLNKTTPSKQDKSTINLTYYGPPEPCTRGCNKKKMEDDCPPCYPCCYPCCPCCNETCCADPCFPTFAPIINYSPEPMPYTTINQDDEIPHNNKVTSSRSTQCSKGADDVQEGFVCNQADNIESLGMFFETPPQEMLNPPDTTPPDKKGKCSCTFQPKVTVAGNLGDNIKKNPKYTTEVSLTKNYTNQIFKQNRREFKKECIPMCDMTLVFKKCPKNPFEKALQAQEVNEEDGNILVPSNIKRYPENEAKVKRDMNCLSMVFDSWKKPCSQNEVNDCFRFECIDNKKIMTKDEYRKSFLERLRKLDMTIEERKFLCGLDVPLKSSSILKKGKTCYEEDEEEDEFNRLPKCPRDVGSFSECSNKRKSNMTGSDCKKPSRGSKSVQIEDSSKLTREMTMAPQCTPKNNCPSELTDCPETFKSATEVKPRLNYVSGEASSRCCECENNILKNIPPCCLSPQTHPEVIQGFSKKLTKDLNSIKSKYASFNNCGEEIPPFCTVQNADQPCNKNRCDRSGIAHNLNKAPRYPKNLEEMGMSPRTSSRSTQEIIETREREMISRKCFESVKKKHTSPRRECEETIERTKMKTTRKRGNSPSDSGCKCFKRSSMSSFDCKPPSVKRRSEKISSGTKPPRGGEADEALRTHKKAASERRTSTPPQRRPSNKEKYQRSSSERSRDMPQPRPSSRLSQRTSPAREQTHFNHRTSDRRNSSQKSSSHRGSSQKASSHRESGERPYSLRESFQRFSSAHDEPPVESFPDEIESFHDDLDRNSEHEDSGHEEPVRRSRNQSARRSSQNEALKRTSYDEAPRRTSHNEAPQRTSHNEAPRRTSHNEAPRRTSHNEAPRREVSGRSAQQQMLERFSSQKNITRRESQQKSETRREPSKKSASHKDSANACSHYIKPTIRTSNKETSREPSNKKTSREPSNKERSRDLSNMERSREASNKETSKRGQERTSNRKSGRGASGQRNESKKQKKSNPDKEVRDVNVFEEFDIFKDF